MGFEHDIPRDTEKPSSRTGATGDLKDLLLRFLVRLIKFLLKVLYYLTSSAGCGDDNDCHRRSQDVQVFPRH